MLRLEGIIPPMLTPFKADEELDEEALRCEARYMLGAGVYGVAVCGSTGEGYALTPEEVGRVCDVVVGEVSGRVPVIAGVIADSAKTALVKALEAKASGVDALMVTPVHYVFKPTDDGLIDFYRRIAHGTRLPIIVYNVIPWVSISAQLALRLTEIREVQGIKQSGGDIHGLADMVKAVGDRIPVLSAIDDMLFPSFMIGAKGAIAAICTITPELCLRLYEAVRESRIEEAKEIHRGLLAIWRAVGKGDMPARAKEAVRMLGRPVGPARSPMVALGGEAREEVRLSLVEAGLLEPGSRS